MARTFAAWSRVRRYKQPAAYARKVLLNRHLLERPSPDGLPRHASRVIAAGTARWSHPLPAVPSACLANGYEQSPAVNDGSLRSVLTWRRSVLTWRSASERERHHPTAVPSKLVARTLLQCRCREEEPMVDSADPTGGGALELARSAAPAPARRRTALAAVARPAGEVAGLLLVEVLRSPRAAALGLARSLARWLAGRRPPASAGVEVTTRRVTV
jgi:hypothetical protein